MFTFFHKTEQQPAHMQVNTPPDYFVDCLRRPSLLRPDEHKDDLDLIKNKIKARYFGEKGVQLNNCSAEQLKAEIQFLSSLFYGGDRYKDGAVKFRNAYCVVYAQHNGIQLGEHSIMNRLLEYNTNPHAVAVAKFIVRSTLEMAKEAYKFFKKSSIDQATVALNNKFLSTINSAKTIIELQQLFQKINLEQFSYCGGNFAKITEFDNYWATSDNDLVEQMIDNYSDEEYEAYRKGFAEMKLGFIPPRRNALAAKYETFLNNAAQKLAEMNPSDPESVKSVGCYMLRTIIDDHFFTEAHGRISRALFNILMTQNMIPSITWGKAADFNESLNTARNSNSDQPFLKFVDQRIQLVVTEHMTKIASKLSSKKVSNQAHALRVAARFGNPSDIFVLNYGLPSLDAQGKTSGTALDVAINSPDIKGNSNVEAICQLMCYRN